MFFCLFFGAYNAKTGRDVMKITFLLLLAYSCVKGASSFAGAPFA